MVRSTRRRDRTEPLDDPAELRPLLKACPEAFLARRIVINEGKTEYGVVLEHLDEWDADTEPEPAPSAALGRRRHRGQRRNRVRGPCRPVPQRSATTSCCSSTATTRTPNTLCRPGRPPTEAPSSVGRGDTQHRDSRMRGTDEAGLTAFIEAAIEVADDPDSARQSTRPRSWRTVHPTAQCGSRDAGREHLGRCRGRPGPGSRHRRARERKKDKDRLVQAGRQGPSARPVHPRHAGPSERRGGGEDRRAAGRHLRARGGGGDGHHGAVRQPQLKSPPPPKK